jgi:hypothetical protein
LIVLALAGDSTTTMFMKFLVNLSCAGLAGMPPGRPSRPEHG